MSHIPEIVVYRAARSTIILLNSVLLTISAAACTFNVPTEPTATVVAQASSLTTTPIQEQETHVELYKIAFEEFLSNPQVQERLTADWLHNEEVYINSEYTDNTGTIPTEIVTMLQDMARNLGVNVVETKTATAAELLIRSIKSDPDAITHYQFSGPTIVLSVHTQSKQDEGQIHTFGLGYRLTETGGVWQTEQYLIFTT